MSANRSLAMLFAALAVSVGVVACGGSDNGNSSSATAAATTKPATATTRPASTTTEPATATTGPAGASTTPTGGAVTAEVKVTAKDFEFNPATLDAPAGKEVTFQLTNAGTATHTLTVYEDAAYTKEVAGASVQASGGQSGEFKVTFARAGDYYFRCELHQSQMQGKIIVQ